MIDFEAHKCPRCEGRKWIRGLVGGVYECPDCWAFEEKILAADKIYKENSSHVNNRLLRPYVYKSEEKRIDIPSEKPKRKYVRKEKTRDL